MNIQKCVIIILFNIALQFSAYAEKASRVIAKNLPQPKPMITLGGIDGEASANTSHVTIRFDRKPSWDALPRPESHGAFLQLVLPDTIVPEPGRFFDGGSELVPKIAVFQITPKDAAIRLFVSKEGSDVLKGLSSDLLDQRMILNFDHQKIISSNLIETQPSKEKVASKLSDTEADIPDYIEGLAKVESADNIIARTEVDRNIPAPASIIKSVANSEAGSQKENDVPLVTVAKKTGPVATEINKATQAPFDLREKLTEITIFFSALFGLLILSLSVRRLMRKRLSRYDDHENLDMKMIASLPLAARQKLSLVQIGQERILIGITPENVSFIANISQQQNHSANFSHLLSQKPISAIEDQKPLSLKPAPKPKLKNLPGNTEDELGITEPKKNLSEEKKTSDKGRKNQEKDASIRKSNFQTTPGISSPSRVNIAVGDEGPKDISKTAGAAKQKNDERPASRESVDDVTKLIREKLRQLKTLS